MTSQAEVLSDRSLAPADMNIRDCHLYGRTSNGLITSIEFMRSLNMAYKIMNCVKDRLPISGAVIFSVNLSLTRSVIIHVPTKSA